MSTSSSNGNGNGSSSSSGTGTGPGLMNGGPRFPFSPYPSGWFAIARSDELPAKAVLPLRYFGQDLVLFRTEDGQARLSGAFCPHLGAHLGYGGTVVGQNLRCPFHGWCFDGPSGRCVEVPFASKIPPRARIQPMPVMEVDGMIVAYRELGGAAPHWQIPSLHSEEWTEAAHVDWRLRSCCQEILENSVDGAHVPTVHDARRPARYIPPPGGSNIHDPVLRHALEIQWDGAYIGAPGTEMEVRLEVSCYGIGLINVDTHVAAMGMTARQRIFVTPIDDQHIHLRAALHVRRLADPEVTKTVEGMWVNAFKTDFVKDFPIWENKAYLSQPLLSEADGPIALLRRWARQFYEPRAQAAGSKAEPAPEHAAEHPAEHSPENSLGHSVIAASALTRQLA
jgi:nitrite reductase/ring-hydroxylating ferredoxin subunit